MRSLAITGSKSLTVREAALGVLKQSGVRPRDYAGEIRALFQYARDRIRYTRDIVGVETLQTPDYTLRQGVGDCDDKSTLLAALLMSVGHPATLEFRAIGTGPPDPNTFRHVYVVANLQGQRIPLDPTNQNQGAGWEYPRPSVQMGVAL
jgi:transglutaminase-like putative cysteine protease